MLTMLTEFNKLTNANKQACYVFNCNIWVCLFKFDSNL